MKESLKKRTLLILCAALIISSAGCGNDAKQTTAVVEETPAIKVNTQVPTYASLEQRATFAGRISPDESVTVIGKVGGTVQQTFFEVGDTVKKGQVLFAIDPVDIQLAVDQAKISYDTALKNIEIAESGSGDSLTELKYKSAIDQSQAAYETARDQLELAYQDEIDMSDFKKHWKKVKNLEREYDKNPTDDSYKAYKDAYDDYMDTLPSYSAYRMQVTQFENAYNGYETALEQYDIYKKQQTGENKENFELQRQAAENGYQQALQKLEYTRVSAPIEGVIEQKNISANETYGQTPAYVISNKSIVNVEFSVSADIARAMTVGDPVEVESGSTAYHAEVVEIGNAASTNSGLFTVKAQIEDGSNLFTGVSVKLTAITAKALDALSIPISAVYYESGKPYVYLAKDGVAVRTPLTLGVATNELVEVLEGMTADDALITSWNPNLNDGSAIEVLDTGAQDAASADPAAAPQDAASTPADQTTADGGKVGQEG